MMPTRLCSQGLFPYEALVAYQRCVDNPTINCEMGALSVTMHGQRFYDWTDPGGRRRRADALSGVLYQLSHFLGIGYLVWALSGFPAFWRRKRCER